MSHIVFVSTNSSKYGAERSLVALASHLRQKTNFTPIVLIPRSGDIESLLRSAEIPYHRLPFQGSVNHGKGIRLFQGVVKECMNIVLAGFFLVVAFFLRYDIKLVHTNTVTTDFGFYLAKFLRVHHVWHCREAVKSAFNFDYELGVRRFAQKVSAASSVIAISEFVRSYYEDYFRLSNVVKIFNGVVLKAESLSAVAHEQRKCFAMVARLAADKQQSSVLDAVLELKRRGRVDFMVDFWGDGPDLELLQNRVRIQEICDLVRFRGFHDQIALSTYIAGLSCGENEAFGRAAVEYMMSGIPVIGVKSGANVELFDTTMGYFYDKQNFEELADRLEHCLDHPDLAKKKGDKAKNHANARFSEEICFSSVINVYNEVLSR